MSEPIQADATIDEIARLLGMKPAKVRRLIDQHAINATRTNCWPLGAIVAAALADARRDKTVDVIAEAERRRVVAAADLAETEARARAGELVERRLFRRVLLEIGTALDNELRVLPHEIAGKDIMLTGRAKAGVDAFQRRINVHFDRIANSVQR
jgi:hypothetical protein